MTSVVRSSLFNIKPLITNFRCKLSTTTAYDPNKQILCLVSEDNEILLRYSTIQDVKIYKIISWFKQTERVIHDVCFDPLGAWLLVLCFDNTLHIVPALKLLDPTQTINNTAFSVTEITSFVIPFVGPHECPNSKTCPNNGSSNTTSSSPLRLVENSSFDNTNQRESSNYDQHQPQQHQSQIIALNQIAVPLMNENNLDGGHEFVYSILESSTDTITSRKSSRKLLKDIEIGSCTNQTASSSNESGGGESFLSSYTCPYPLCVTWWQTIDKRNRAVIGYSDGSICFVALTPNCPFIGNTSIENGAVCKLVICRDNNDENVTLLINSSTKEQWKLLLEQKSIKYIFPTDISPTSTSQNSENSRSGDDWTFVMQIQQPSNINTNTTIIEKQPDSVKTIDQKTDETGSSNQTQMNGSQNPCSEMNNENVGSLSKGILPAAKARLSLLRNLGTKKLNAFKMKLSDAKSKFDGYISEESLNSFTMIDSPTTIPEILTTSAGPYYSAHNLRNTLLLSALHSYSDILSIHRMDLKLIPLFHYKIPKNCQEIMISSNLLYSIQLVKNTNTNANNNNNNNNNNEIKNAITENNNNITKDENNDDNDKLINAVGVISSAMASIKNGDILEFNERALFGLFPFSNETIINIHRMGVYETIEKQNQMQSSSLNNENNNNINTNSNNINNNNKDETIRMEDVKTPSNYIRLHKNLKAEEEFTKYDIETMRKEFPKINYDPCIVVTNKNTYFIDLHKEPHIYFLNAAISGKWDICEEFCTTFDLSFGQCIEYAGDCLLRKKKVTQALLTYNIAHIPPVRTALKLAMYGENYALMHLCAVALKTPYLLNSHFINHNLIKYLLNDCNRRHCNDMLSILPKNIINSNEIINEGKLCSDYSYDSNEPIGALQMSTSSQFHLSNLLLITLTERAVKEKNYNLAVWNFIASNTKFHTNMTSIVLCQSGLYMAALLLAMIRGCCVDVFVGFVSVSHQEFGWYSEINVLFYNLSELLFCECITYLRHVSADYFDVIQNKLHKFDETVLQRLEAQLNPFMAVFRPIISHRYLMSVIDENDSELLEFSKLLVETYLAVIMQLDAIKTKPSNILNALNTHRINYEDNRFAIKTSNFPPISVGFSHSACVIDGYAYFWGTNGIPCVYNVGKPIDPPEPPHVVKYLEILAQLNLEVHVVKCGRQHSLVLTNNGLYAFGSNIFGQLGINKKMQVALQPMLVESLDGKDITALEAGQYHNAAIADGKLYTWGWGAYGQLGHGDIENVPEPKIVSFFREKRVIQVSLGHSHSMVLCKQSNGNTNLYVFGSNHFGQLGNNGNIQNGTSSSQPHPIKSLVPIRVNVSSANIRLIHTKFFCSFAVDENNELYAWGLSPQALRLSNQVKRRANAKQKIEENLKKEISRRLEGGLKESECIEISIPVPPPSILTNSTKIPIDSTHTETPLKKSLSSGKLVDGIIKEKELEEGRNDGLLSFQRRHSDSTNNSTLKDLKSVEENSRIKIEIEKVEIIDDNLISKSIEDLKSNNEGEKIIEENLKFENVNKTEESSKKLQNNLETETYEYMTPQKVDTSEVSGQILQISSGLLHFALISSTSMLFTWGKNLEHQLGTEDKDRRPVNKPTPLESIENPLHVECGADFTIVITRDYVVKAFGGNANGQCGRDLSPPSDKSRPVKLFCLPTTKRLMRLEGNCVESPIDVNLPRPQIRMDSEPTRYMKFIPKFRQSFVIKPNISLELDSSKSAPSGISGGISDDGAASSIENISFLDEDSLCSALTGLRNLSSNDVSPDNEHFTSFNFENNHNHNSSISSTDITEFRNYIHYCLYIFHGLYDPEKIEKFSNNNLEYRIRMLMLNFKYVNAFIECLLECHNAQQSLKIFEFFTKDPSIVPMRRKDLKFFIYHLFIHFISKNFDTNECEKFFLCNLDYYLLDLSYVMYFNNNNSDLEQKLNQKFKTFFMNDLVDDNNSVQEFKLDNTDIIFETLSIKFKTIVCQRLLQTYKI